MNPMETILLHEKEFTKSEILIKDSILNNLDLIVCHPLVAVAKEMKVSKSALLRFCQKCGYEGFSEFKYEISRFMHSGNLDQSLKENSTNEICDMFANAILSIKDIQLDEKLTSLSKDLLKSTRIRILGVHESGLAAHHLQYRLTTLGIDADYVETGIAAEKANLSKKNDFYIFFSLSSTTPEIIEALNNALAQKCSTALITQNNHSRFRSKTDHFILIPTFDTAVNKIFLDSQYLNFIIVELIINSLSKLL